jgi:hypothetical protein
MTHESLIIKVEKPQVVLETEQIVEKLKESVEKLESRNGDMVKVISEVEARNNQVVKLMEQFDVASFEWDELCKRLLSVVVLKLEKQ